MEVKVQQSVKEESSQNKLNRRKQIQKVKRKLQRQNQRIVKDYAYITNEPRSALGSYMVNNNNQQCDFQMNNHITMGQNRKLKKKMKKLNKKMQGDQDKIFKQIQKYKQGLYKGHQKKIFNPVNQLQQRRDKRMKKMQQNAKKRKAQIIQKDINRFE